MRSFLDTAIFMYAAGGTHPLKPACSAILARFKSGSLDATTSAEVVQEIVHRYMSIGRTEAAVKLARETLTAFRPVLAISDAVARRLPDLAERYPALDARDLVHVATCIEHGIDTIISPDRGFDQVNEIRRLPPLDAAA